MSRGALSLVFSLDNKPCKGAVAVHWLGVTIPVAKPGMCLGSPGTGLGAL